MESEPVKERVIIARPGALPWILAGFCWLMAFIVPVLAQSRADNGGRGVDWLMTAFAALFCVALGLLPALYAVLSRTIAGAKGLRWRVWTPRKPSLTWQTAAWNEIADFYDEINWTGAVCRVKTGDGRTLTFGHDWRELIPLRETIAERAAFAESARDQTGKPAWMLKGARPSELPVMFAYSEARLQKLWLEAWGSGIGVLGIVASVMAALIALAPHRIAPKRAEDVLPLSIIFGLMGVGLVSSVVWSIYSEGRNFRAAHGRRHRGEKFVAERDGLTVWAEGEARKIPWNEIVGYEFPLQSNRNPGSQYTGIARFRARTGEEYSYTPLIENYNLFAVVLRQFATEAVEFRREQNEKEALGGVAARWGGGDEGKGERVFHHRTRTMRAAVVSSDLLFAVSLWGVIRLLMTPFAAIALTLCVPIALLTGVLAWMATAEYLRDRVLVGVEDVTCVNRHGHAQRLRWEDMDRIWTEDNVIVLSGKDGSRIQLNTSGYAYGNELPALLTERLSEYRRAVKR